MSLSQKLADALDLIPADGVPASLTVVDGRHTLSLELTAAGPVGLAFDTLAFSTGPAPELSGEALRSWSDRLAARVTYLMEPLVVVELDPGAGEAELRSQSPTPRGDQNAYYEVRLNARGALSLSRVIFDAGTRRRRPAPCHLTREVLERLADDLVATAE